MSLRLAGKTALVTAAAQGIGRASALALTEAGATVWATDANKEALAALAAEQHPNLKTLYLDVMNEHSIKTAYALIGELDILFNCAGYVHHGTILEIDDKAWDFSFDLNVKSMLRTIQTWLPGMVAKKSGSIINMASVASSLKGAPNRSLYGASKAAVIGLTKSVAIDFVSQGVRCNVICPGTVESPSLQSRIENQAHSAGKTIEQVRAEFVARQPLGRLAKASEIAALVVYLGSDESGFTTGAVHIIDGGWSI